MHPTMPIFRPDFYTFVTRNKSFEMLARVFHSLFPIDTNVNNAVFKINPYFQEIVDTCGIPYFAKNRELYYSHSF